ncbi:hypothetical protein ACFV0T_26530 [Streptomyces sp. NPDC059582]|uniref:hypothetical protein n=1 Tax=Streptomyces sp. NPDC059582 TaxID=3346875 RepID=UPI003697A7F6
MAISIQTPYSAVADLVSLKEASALFAKCGPGREVNPRTLARWAKKHGVDVHRSGRDSLADWADLLEIHALETDRREAQAAQA